MAAQRAFQVDYHAHYIQGAAGVSDCDAELSNKPPLMTEGRAAASRTPAASTLSATISAPPPDSRRDNPDVNTDQGRGGGLRVRGEGGENQGEEEEKGKGGLRVRRLRKRESWRRGTTVKDVRGGGGGERIGGEGVERVLCWVTERQIYHRGCNGGEIWTGQDHSLVETERGRERERGRRGAGGGERET